MQTITPRQHALILAGLRLLRDQMASAATDLASHGGLQMMLPPAIYALLREADAEHYSVAALDALYTKVASDAVAPAHGFAVASTPRAVPQGGAPTPPPALWPVTAGPLRSISDDDLCSDCSQCHYRPGDASGCIEQWPGVVAATGPRAGYISACRAFAQRTPNAFEMACPACGGTEHLDVAVQIDVRLTSDGTDADEAATADDAHSWRDDSACGCDNCGWTGTVADARTE